MDNLYIEKVLSGDRESFRYFIGTYKDMAFTVAISLAKNEHLAEEIVQDAFVQAYLSLSSFKKQSKFSTWFYRIVVHCAYKLLNKKSIQTTELNLNQHDVQLDENALKKLLFEEQKQIINEALIRISANESLALRLFYLEELSIQELCEITGWTISNAKVILHRARNSMYTTLNLLSKGVYHGS